MYRLKTNGKHSYSERELAIFKLLNGRHRLSTGDMVAAMYRGQEPPLNARTTFNGNMRMLIEKMQRNEEPFCIYSNGKGGPFPKEYWLGE